MNELLKLNIESYGISFFNNPKESQRKVFW